LEFFRDATAVGVHNILFLVAECILPDEKDQVALAFSVGGNFDADILISHADSLQYLHDEGSVLALPFVVRAAYERPESAAHLVSMYLFRYGFYRSFTCADNPAFFLWQTPKDIRRDCERKRKIIVDSLPHIERRGIGRFFYNLATPLLSIDEEDNRSLRKLRRWLGGLLRAERDAYWPWVSSPLDHPGN